MNEQPKRRLILPEKRTQAELKIRPDDVSFDTILADAMQTAAIEIAKYKMKVARGNTLDLKEARILQGWIETMVKLKKDQRDEEKDGDLGKLSQEELLALAKKALLEDAQKAKDDSENS